MNRFLPNLPTAFAFSLAVALAGCLKGKSENPNDSGGENEVKGILRLTDGNLAPGAKVRLHPVNFSPLQEDDDSADTYSAITDSRGVYRIQDVRPGEYNVLGGLDSLLSFRDSVGITAGQHELPPDTLRAPGSINGFVALQPIHLPSTATVEILGTRYLAKVDTSGAFRFPSLAGGRYSIRVSTTLPEYTSLKMSITVKGGASENLADTLRPEFSGIPVVTGLRASYDTLHSVVRLAWDPVRYNHLENYLIYRNPADQLDPSGVVIGSSQDTVFLDTLRDSVSGVLGTPPARSLRYRIKVRNKADQIGPSFGSLVVATPPPSEVTTVSTLRLARFEWSAALQADSVTVRVDLKNQTRGLDSITWALAKEDSVVARHDLGGRGAETDSIRFLWPKPGSFHVFIQVKDDAGDFWRDSLLIRGNSAPSIQPGTLGDTVQVASLFRYKPTATDPDGDSLKFTVENLPSWASFDPVTGEVKGTPEKGQEGEHGGLTLSVSDGRRKATLPPIRILVTANPWSLRSMPASITGPMAISFGDEIVILSAGKKEIIPDGAASGTLESGLNIHVYTPKEDVWKERGFVIESEIVKSFGNEPEIAIHSVYPAGGRILLVAGNQWMLRPFLIDPSTGKLEPRMFASKGRKDYTTSFADGKLYIMGGYSSGISITPFEEYNPATDQWTFRNNVPYTVYNATAVGVGDQIVLFGGYRSADIPQNALRYTPATDTWIPKTQVANPFHGYGFGACVAGGKVYAYAGKTNNPKPDSYSGLLQRYDPSTDKWTIQTGPILARDSRPASCAESDGKLYFFGGATSPANGVINHHAAVEVYNPALDKP